MSPPTESYHSDFLCTWVCCFIASFRLNSLPHTGQTKALRLVCIRACLFMTKFVANPLPHVRQVYTDFPYRSLVGATLATSRYSTDRGSPDDSSSNSIERSLPRPLLRDCGVWAINPPKSRIGESFLSVCVEFSSARHDAIIP